jgi:hypothetical protein
MNAGELTVGVLEIECNRTRRFAGPAADLGLTEFKALLGNSIRTLCSAPVTGLRIGSPVESTTLGISSRARRASTSTSNVIG